MEVRDLAWRSLELLLLRIIERGEHPEPEDLARLLRSPSPIPPPLRAHIADVLEGKIKRKRGRKPAGPVQRTIAQLHREALAQTVRRLARFYKHCGVRGGRGQQGAFDQALAKVARKYHVSPDTLRTYVYPETYYPDSM